MAIYLGIVMQFIMILKQPIIHYMKASIHNEMLSFHGMKAQYWARPMIT
jgi:hypothetical protein